MDNKTIAAIATAQGEGGIGVIRISGGKVIEIADKVFRSVNDKKLSGLKGYSAAFGHIVKDNEAVDECVAMVFREPKSYTGEDVVELSCHGGLFITREVLRIVLDEGAILAQAGEFTKRAFLNGKMDLTEAEAVADIISAKSRIAARAALCAKEGALWNKIEAVKNKLVATAAHLSAWADYPDEDIEEVSTDNLSASFIEVKGALDDLLSTYDKGQIIKEGIDTVIAGKPNAGKSTLMNLLSGHDRSIVTEIPGTTRDIIEEKALVGDVVLRLSDTAGIRDTEDTVGKIGVDLAKQRLRNSGLVLAVFDSSEKLDQNDYDLIEAVKDLETVAVINKDDLESKIDENDIKSKIKRVVKLSAKTGEGRDSLEKIITEIAGTENFNPSEGILANERQRQAALNARDSLNEAIESLNMGMTFDAVGVALEDAIGYILELSGERVSDVVVDNVFHNFCVGK